MNPTVVKFLFLVSGMEERSLRHYERSRLIFYSWKLQKRGTSGGQLLSGQQPYLYIDESAKTQMTVLRTEVKEAPRSKSGEVELMIHRS